MASGSHRLLRSGRRAWAVIGIVVVLALVAYAASRVSLVVVPLILAVFPAALLQPVAAWLIRHRLPPALAAVVVLLAGLGVLAATVALLVPALLAQVPALTEALSRGVELVDEGLSGLPFGAEIETVPDLLRTIGQNIDNGVVVNQAFNTARRVIELAAATVLLLVVLFFYLKDGRRITNALVGFLPEPTRSHVQELADRMWTTMSGYFRGQLLVALVDAVFIGLGIWLLGVPLVLPLAVLVFLGGLFPFVGAFLSGLIAVLVALAHGGLGTALATLAVVVVVQQLEGNVLEPLVMSRFVGLHPLTVLLSVAAGGLLLGILGAFLAVPVAACAARLVEYLRERRAIPGGDPPAPSVAQPDDR